MKKRVLLVLFSLSMVTQITMAKHVKKTAKKIDPVVQVALESKNLSSEKRSAIASSFDNPDTICCKRGKRGRRGSMGPRGRSDCGPNELFINAFMMSWFDSEVTSALPPTANFSPYTASATMAAWTLFPSVDIRSQTPIGANFNIPIDLDRTQPVTVVIHLLVDSDPDVIGDQVKLQVNIDYQPDGGIVGVTLPGTNFAETIVSSDFSVTGAIPIGSDNLRQIGVSVPLNPALIDGEWSFITVGRIVPASNEFSGNVYLSTISVQYTRICS